MSINQAVFSIFRCTVTMYKWLPVKMALEKWSVVFLLLTHPPLITVCIMHILIVPIWLLCMQMKFQYTMQYVGSCKASENLQRAILN